MYVDCYEFEYYSTLQVISNSSDHCESFMIVLYSVASHHSDI